MLYTSYMPNRNEKTLVTDTINSDAYTGVIVFSDSLPVGTYEFVVSFVVSNPDTNDSLFWKVIGDNPSPEFSIENKDATDQIPSTYVYQYQHAGGVMVHTLQMRKEDVAAVDISVLAAGIYVKRVA